MSTYFASAELAVVAKSSGVLSPPHFQPAVSKQFKRTWSIANVLLDCGDYRR